jgi:diguanylate cyclase (GGDEF)-like protein
MPDTIDISNLTLVRDSISGITGIPLAIYGDNGNIVILPPAAENKVTTYIRASVRGKKEYDEFMRKSVAAARLRRDISFYKGPGGQYYFFVPVRADKDLFVIAGGGIYFEQKDFEEFYGGDGKNYGLDHIQLRAWLQEIVFNGHGDIKQTARHVQALFHHFLGSYRENSLHAKQYRLTKTILSLLSGVELDKQTDEVYDLLSDIPLFLFSADSVSVVVEENKKFRQVRASGRLKGYLESISTQLAGSLPVIAEMKGPFYSEDMKDILRLGLDDQIMSIHAFPMTVNNETVGFLCIFNTNLSQEDADIISELCMFVGFIFKIVDLRNTYQINAKHMDVLNMAAANITTIKAADALYETIVDMSVRLAGAEKGSLMLCENGSSHLTIMAAKGINKRLLSEIKVRSGEGIAGRVFEEGLPLMGSDRETPDQVFSKRRPNYRTDSFLSIPLTSGGKTIGVLNISDKTTGAAFSEEDVALLRSFAAYASIAIERSFYYNLVGRLKELSITDPLTELFNRRYFEERLIEELNRSERYALPFSLAIIDIDDFKLFNDSEGHLAGDDALKGIATIAKDSLRAIDVIARFGGEEFAVIMPQTEKEEAFVVVERIRQSVKEHMPRTWKTFPKDHITVCIGIAGYPSDGKDRRELIRNADKALFSAKMQGKDRTIACGETRS